MNDFEAFLMHIPDSFRALFNGCACGYAWRIKSEAIRSLVEKSKLFIEVEKNWETSTM